MRLLLPFFVVLTSACAPAVCGEISLGNVDPNPDIEKFRRSDGRLGLVEYCGVDYGAFSYAREDLGLTTITLDQNIPDDVALGDISPIPRVVLPVGTLVLWSANLVAGKTLTLANLAGSGLHKRNEPMVYDVYPLTAATLTVLEGPIDHREETLIDTVTWSESWRLRWSVEYGGGVQKWEGEDVVSRKKGTEVGSSPFFPPDPKP